MTATENNQPGPESEPRYGSRPRGGYRPAEPSPYAGADPSQGQPAPSDPGETHAPPSDGEPAPVYEPVKSHPTPNKGYRGDPTGPIATEYADGEPAEDDLGEDGSGEGFGPDEEGYPSNSGEPDQGSGTAAQRGTGAADQSGYTPETKPHPCPPSMTCNTGTIDDLSSEAKGVKAESDALTAAAPKLEERRKAFETARTEYTKARDEAAQTRKELDRRLIGLVADIICLLNRDVVKWVDKAFRQVEDCLDEYTECQGCCVDEDCGFEGAKWTVGQIDDLTRRIVKIEKCFDEEVVKEPANLKQRVADAKKLVDDLQAAMKIEPKDPTRLYAQAKEARRALEQLWGRFADVNEFQTCLCRGLTCSLSGRRILAQLAGDKAYQDSQEEARLKRRDWLLKNIVEETLAVVLLISPPSKSYAEGESTETDVAVEAPES